MTKVKICGITNHDDAVWALNYGADFLGVNFYKGSPRHVLPNTAAKWIAQLPPFAHVVGVFLNDDVKTVCSAIEKLNLKAIQLHGDETPAFCAEVRDTLQKKNRSVTVIKAVRVLEESSLAALADFRDVVDYFLLDSFAPGQAGGTGQTFNWDLAIKAKEAGKPIFLAGGLTPENVKEAVKKVGPFAVDVASGVEHSPRRKDLKKLQDFISHAKN